MSANKLYRVLLKIEWPQSPKQLAVLEILSRNVKISLHLNSLAGLIPHESRVGKVTS